MEIKLPFRLKKKLKNTARTTQTQPTETHKEFVSELERFQEVLKKQREELQKFHELLEKSDESLEASAELCRFCGVPEDQIIHNEEELDRYFTE